MLIIPAIDIKNGKCVRLVEGREGTETVFADDPLTMARRWVKEGARYLHVVDLDGAFGGKPANFEKVREIITEAGVPVEFGGGVRETSVVEALVEAGADRVIVGSALVDNFDWAAALFKAYPERIAVGIDAREGKVAIHGWTKLTDVDAYNLAVRCEDAGASAVIYTDIARDGRMQGANFAGHRVGRRHRHRRRPVAGGGRLRRVHHRPLALRRQDHARGVDRSRLARVARPQESASTRAISDPHALLLFPRPRL
jgi:phosphoribosylformimino-5-aminoimidazole carboxamide ribotide isomerase